MFLVHYSREPHLSVWIKHIKLIDLFRESPIICVGQTLDFMLSHMIFINFDQWITSFRFGEDTEFHVSWHDLNSKDISKKGKNKEDETYVQSDLWK